MAHRNIAEVGAGAAVLLVAAGFLFYAVANSDRGSSAGYTLHARFDRIDGLNVGADVRVAGVKVGNVVSEKIDPKNYLADVSFTIQSGIQLPKDSSATVSTEGLLGGKYLAVVPGGDEQMIPPGGRVTITQSAVSLEDLLGKFIFSVTDMANTVKATQKSSDK